MRSEGNTVTERKGIIIEIKEYLILRTQIILSKNPEIRAVLEAG